MLVVWHAKKGEGKNCVQLHQGGVVRLSCFYCYHVFFFFFSSRRRHTRFDCDWSSDVCSSDLKRKVLYAIERVGYTPNIHARNLASGQSRTLGLIISDITNPFFPDLVKSIQERALELGYDVIVLNTNYEPERDSRYEQRLLELRVRGVMILTTEMDLSVIERLSSREIAVVFLDIGKVGPHTSNIRVNYEKGVHEAVEHL